ncbi:LysR substrate-binding domain-containing protein [Paraburkholderia phosphatilytica]|uniref:LysR substrate-binding domain-containing protein n=1 Tax=Paraburkholderia phosphatilytica TaxID=2282883 RepID=UPI000E4FCF0C|nr:LysR substrate-binding domain-containing protein [Paraburkholderia phosphatilytica]
MRFDLTDLRLFLTVIEQGSLTRGAQTLHLALASVSERIAGMETTLGTPLLERNRRGVSATAAGDALARHARSILEQVEQMRGELRTYAAGLKGRIRVLSNTAALAAFLPSRLGRFLADHPDLSIDLDERPSAEIVLALADGRADLGIVADIADLSALQTHLIAQDQLVVIAPHEHHIVTGRPVVFADLLDEAFVGVADAALEMHLAERASRLGRQLNHRIRLHGIENVAMLVEAGVGIAILSQASIEAVRHRRVTIAPLSDRWATRQLHLCARDFATLTRHARLLAQQLTDGAANA